MLRRVRFDRQFSKMVGQFQTDADQFKDHLQADRAKFGVPPPVAVPQSLVQSATRGWRIADASQRRLLARADIAFHAVEPALTSAS